MTAAKRLMEVVAKIDEIMERQENVVVIPSKDVA
jgi:hypothetical protein